MKKYELFTVFKPNLDTEEVDKLLNKFDEDLAALGGKVETRDKIGRKKLAYDIKKFRDGFIVSTIVSIAPEKVADYKRLYVLNDNVLRIMLMDVTEKESAKA